MIRVTYLDKSKLDDTYNQLDNKSLVKLVKKHLANGPGDCSGLCSLSNGSSLCGDIYDIKISEKKKISKLKKEALKNNNLVILVEDMEGYDLIEEGIKQFVSSHPNETIKPTEEPKLYPIQKIENKIGFITYITDDGKLCTVDFDKNKTIEVFIKEEILHEESKKELDSIVEGFSNKSDQLNPMIACEFSKEQLEKYKNLKSKLKGLFVDVTKQFVPQEEPRILESCDC